MKQHVFPIIIRIFSKWTTALRHSQKLSIQSGAHALSQIYTGPIIRSFNQNAKRQPSEHILMCVRVSHLLLLHTHTHMASRSIRQLGHEVGVQPLYLDEALDEADPCTHEYKWKTWFINAHLALWIERAHNLAQLRSLSVCYVNIYIIINILHRMQGNYSSSFQNTLLRAVIFSNL